MILREIASRIAGARINREQTLRRKNAGMLVIGVAIGSTVGAVAGLLFAPKAGKETREDLSRISCQTWGKVKDNVATTGHRLVNSAEEQSSRLRTAAEKGVDAARESLHKTSATSEEDNG